MNPLHLEYKRTRRNALVLLVLLAFAGAALDYFWGLQQRLAQRQAMLHAAAEDLDHQLKPFVELLHTLTVDATQQLQQTALPTSATQPLQGSQWSISTAAVAFSAAEVQLLNQLRTFFQLSQRTLPSLEHVYYASMSGTWYQPAERVQPWQQTQAELFSQKYQQQAREALPKVWLTKVQTDSSRYLLVSPVYLQQQWVGEFILELDLTHLLKNAAIAQDGAKLQLFDEGGELLVAVGGSESSEPQQLHTSDKLRMLSTLPLSLHVEPDLQRTFADESLDFIVQLLLFLATLFTLFWYFQQRFRSKVLSPFLRLQVHVDRLAKGDPQGVRQIPSDWQTLFRQLDQLRLQDPKEDMNQKNR